MHTLESEVRELAFNQTALLCDHNLLKLKVNSLQAKGCKISLREIARTVERHICVRAAGSKGLAKRELFRLEKFKGSTLEGALQKTLQSLGLTALLIERLKNNGDDVAHDNRDTLTLSEVEHLLNDSDFNDDEKQREEIRCFISALHTFKMVHADGLCLVSNKPF